MSAHDDPNSRRCSDHARRERQYARWMKDGKYEELMRDYLSNRCPAQIVWTAFDALMRELHERRTV